MPGITDIKTTLTARASEARVVIRRAPFYWLLIGLGGVMASALMLEGGVAFEWWAMLWRDETGSLTYAGYALALLFGAITALVLGAVLHLVYLRIPLRSRGLFYLTLAVLAVIVIMAGPVAVSLSQPSMSGNTIDPTGEQGHVDRLLYWTTLSRALLFLLAAIVAAIGIGMVHEGLKGLGTVRQAKADCKEHEDALDAITLAEDEAKNLHSHLDQYQGALKRDFAIVYRDAMTDEASRVEQYLAGERPEPVNSFNLDAALRDLVRPEDQGGNAFLKKLIDVSCPKPINFRAMPVRARDLPGDARHMLSEHASWLRARGDIHNLMEELT